MGALGITPDLFPRKIYSDKDIQKAQAALDPADKNYVSSYIMLSKIQTMDWLLPIIIYYPDQT